MAGMGVDDDRRHAKAMADRPARRVVPRIADELCRAENTQPRPVRSALGIAIVLSRVQPRQRRAARNGSIRRHQVMTTMSISRSRHAPLAMDAETFRILGHHVVTQN